MPPRTPAAPAPLPSRNVTFHDSTGGLIGGLWQHGSFSVSLIYRCLETFVTITPAQEWRLWPTSVDGSPRTALDPNSAAPLPIGEYEVLSTDGASLDVSVSTRQHRRRSPTGSATERTSDYRERARARDGRCLITGVSGSDWSRLKAAHIFPRSWEEEWNRRHFGSQITDTAPLEAVGGSSRIDSIQNVVLLRADLASSWDAYTIAVNPGDGHRVHAFTNGAADLDGGILDLTHITDPTVRPLDVLLRDHFFQCVLAHMRGAAEALDWDPYEEFDRDGFVNLEQDGRWTSGPGKQAFELSMSDKLHGARVEQELAGMV